ncbi:hypothetical protein BH18GEM1_BH18GEM1_18840 [soil metagenome]
MKHVETGDAAGFFDVVAGTDRSQAATMDLEPGRSTGGPDNRYPETDQWLYVVSGRGRRGARNRVHRRGAPLHDQCVRAAGLLSPLAREAGLPVKRTPDSVTFVP